jgi:hypothetical protein
MIALVLAWIALRARIAPMWADVLSLFLLGPMAVVLSVSLVIWLHRETRQDAGAMLARLRQRMRRPHGSA